MRALTYNILGEPGEDAEQRLSQVTALLQAARPDVLGLNECMLLGAAGGARLSQLEAALDMEARLARADSGQHVALLVRAGVFDKVEILQRGFAHAALIADVRVQGRALRVICVHLDPYSPEHRLAEVELLRPHLQGEALLLGDLNALSPHDVAHAQPERWVERYRKRHVSPSGAIDTRALECLERRGLVDVHASLHAQALPTRPTQRYAKPDRPSQRLDYIFASAELARSARVCEPFPHGFSQQASDHLPLYADFDLTV